MATLAIRQATLYIEGPLQKYKGFIARPDVLLLRRIPRRFQFRRWNAGLAIAGTGYQATVAKDSKVIDDWTRELREKSRRKVKEGRWKRFSAEIRTNGFVGRKKNEEMNRIATRNRRIYCETCVGIYAATYLLRRLPFGFILCGASSGIFPGEAHSREVGGEYGACRGKTSFRSFSAS